jgi:esterase/lipase
MHPKMLKIPVSTLILWGRHDGILPAALADTVFDKFGTNTHDKYKYIFG